MAFVCTLSSIPTFRTVYFMFKILYNQATSQMNFFSCSVSVFREKLMIIKNTLMIDAVFWQCQTNMTSGLSEHSCSSFLSAMFYSNDPLRPVFMEISADAVDVRFDKLSLPPHLYLQWFCMFWRHMTWYLKQLMSSYQWICYDNKALIWSLLLSVGLFSVWPFIFHMHLFTCVSCTHSRNPPALLDSYCVMSTQYIYSTLM